MTDENFKITGFYYKNQGYKFRKYLNIKRKNTNKTKPDLMVVMMNPGSSSPIENIYDIETPALPDKTQNQIIKVMNNCALNYARILNLSDYMEAKSNNFYKKIKELDEKEILHSIFNIQRRKELKNLFIKNIPVIFAWGVNNSLNELSKNAIDVLKVKFPIGFNKNNNKYYHPLSRNNKSQINWVKKITTQFNK